MGFANQQLLLRHPGQSLDPPREGGLCQGGWARGVWDTDPLACSAKGCRQSHSYLVAKLSGGCALPGSRSV